MRFLFCSERRRSRGHDKWPLHFHVLQGVLSHRALGLGPRHPGATGGRLVAVTWGPGKSSPSQSLPWKVGQALPLRSQSTKPGRAPCSFQSQDRSPGSRFYCSSIHVTSHRPSCRESVGDTEHSAWSGIITKTLRVLYSPVPHPHPVPVHVTLGPWRGGGCLCCVKCLGHCGQRSASWCHGPRCPRRPSGWPVTSDHACGWNIGKESPSPNNNMKKCSRDGRVHEITASLLH